MPPKEQKKDYECKDKQMPEIISHYNENRDGVDTVDHLISPLLVEEKITAGPWIVSSIF